MSEPQRAIHLQLSQQASSLQALARCLVNDSFRSDAEDFVQDTFVKALSQTTPPRQLEPWLRQVLRNKVRDHGRQNLRRNELRQQFLEIPDSSPTDETTEVSALFDSLYDVLNRLKEPYRETIQLRFFQDRTTTEIAHRMHCPPGTVRWRIHEGLQRMRHDLDQRFGSRNLWCNPVTTLVIFLDELRRDVASPGPPPTSTAQTSSPPFNGAQPSKSPEYRTSDPNSTNASPTDPSPTSLSSTKELTMKSLLITIATTTAISSGLTAIAYESRPAHDPFANAPPSATLPAEKGSAPASKRTTIAKRPSSPASAMPVSWDQTQETSAPSSRAEKVNSPLSDHCDTLIAEARSQGNFEIEVIIAGGPSNTGNQVAHVSAVRGSAACLNGPQGPHPDQDPHLAALASCVYDTFDPSWFEPPLSPGAWTCEVRPFSANPQQKIGPRGGFRLRRFEPAPVKDDDHSCCDEPLPFPNLPKDGLTAQNAGVFFNAPHLGAGPRAPVSVLVCGGYENQRSNMARATMNQLAADYPSEVATYWLHNPSPNTPGVFASRFAIAAQKQGKFWEVHRFVSEHIFENLEEFESTCSDLGLDTERIKQDMSSLEISQALADQRAFCLQNGALAKPSFVINGKVLEGLPAYRDLRHEVDEALKTAK